MVLPSGHFDESRNLIDAFNRTAETFADRIAFRQPERPWNEETMHNGDGNRWAGTPYSTVRERVERIGEYLESIGVAKGERVVILSNTRPEWVEAELGIYSAAGSVVTAYPTDPADRNGYVLFDSGAKVVFAENQQQVDKLVHLLAGPFMVPKTEAYPSQFVDISIRKIITFEEVQVPEEYRHLVVRLSEILDAPSVKRPSGAAALGRDDEATIIYTSGTTGAAKGVIATHGEHLANIRQVLESGLLPSEGSVFHVLPEAHGFGMRMVHIALFPGYESRYPAVIDHQSSMLSAPVRESLRHDLADSNSNVIPVVPKMLERMHAGVLNEIGKGGIRGRVLDLIVRTYTKVFEAEQNGEPLDRETRITKAILESPLLGGIGPRVQRKIREQLVGNDLKFLVSGGGPFPQGIARFFWANGMPVYEGYGSTETNVPITCNTTDHCRLGSVGRVLSPDIELKLAPDGELLGRGPNFAHRYHGKPNASAERWDADGWCHTNDICEIDEDGYLYIKGRKDDIIVTTTGENIQPERIEGKLKEISFISEAVVVGHGRPGLVALATLNEGAVNDWAAEHKIEVTRPLHKDPKVAELVRDAVDDHVNLDPSLNSYERVRNVALIPELSIGNGMTPSLKVQRKQVMEQHGALIEAMYDEFKTAPSRTVTTHHRQFRDSASTKELRFRI